MNVHINVDMVREKYHTQAVYAIVGMQLIKEVRRMEIKILDWIQTLRTPILDQVMRFITTLGNAGIVWIALAIILLVIPRKRKTGSIVTASLVINIIVVNLILKNVFARIRPFNVNTAVQLLIAKPTDYSFPSGHTAMALTVVTALFLAGEKKLAWTALVLAVLIAFSRMYLYVHYPTDILGGVVVGILCGLIGKWFINEIEKKKKMPVG